MIERLAKYISLCVLAFLIVFSFLTASIVRAQDGTIPPASDSSGTAPANVNSAPTPAPVPAASSSAPTTTITPKTTPAANAPTVNPQVTSTANPDSLPGNVAVPQAPAGPASQTSNKGIVGWIVASVVVLAAAIGGLIYKMQGNSQDQSSDDPCGRIKQQLEQKQAELDQTGTELSVKQELADELQQKLRDKGSDTADKFREKAVAKVFKQEVGGKINQAVDIALTGKETYDELQEKWEQAKQVVDVLKTKHQQLSQERDALRSSYNSCVLTAAARDLAPYVATLTNSPGAQTIFLFGGAEVEWNQAVPEIKMMGEVLRQLKAKQVLHIPFARITSSEEDWSGDWFNRNIQIPGLEYLNAANEADIAKADSPVILISGGHEHDNLMDRIAANPKLQELIKNARYIIGESAGAKALGEYMRSGHLGSKNTKLVNGLDIVKNTVISPHYTEHNREPELLHDMEKSGMKYGIGIDSFTAMIFNVDEFPEKYKKIGAGNVEIKRT